MHAFRRCCLNKINKCCCRILCYFSMKDIDSQFFLQFTVLQQNVNKKKQLVQEKSVKKIFYRLRNILEVCIALQILQCNARMLRMQVLKHALGNYVQNKITYQQFVMLIKVSINICYNQYLLQKRYLQKRYLCNRIVLLLLLLKEILVITISLVNFKEQYKLIISISNSCELELQCRKKKERKAP
eukprot:TRINITY_DN14027_c0_g1_i1.p1 TRINITY_DN14027_c0_g1~~TRINITY_DN14027_c0_g1_i1.p1  ORF type:complete len:185 (-),score=-10.70 TRINITY_DN14027_c0_g1_i1:204-758(-)